MDDRGRRFLGLEPTNDGERWRFPIRPGVCGGTGFLHGGCALAAMVSAMEGVTDRSVVWATAQYMARVEPPQVVDITVEVRAHGRANSQAAAMIHDGDRLIAAAMATLGGRDLGIDNTWAAPPDVPPPQDCPPRARSEEKMPNSFTALADIRIARASLGEPEAVYWCRLADGVHGTSVGMSALGDLLPSAMRMAVGVELRGSSLDNSVRILHEAETEWLLVHAITEGYGRSIGHGHVRFFSQEGHFLGTAGQSFGPSTLRPEIDVLP